MTDYRQNSDISGEPASYDVAITLTMRLTAPVTPAEAAALAVEQAGIRRDLNITVTDIHVHRNDPGAGQ